MLQWNPPLDDPTDPLRSTVGHWSNPDWSPGEAGIYGFVAGVSDYPYMRLNPGWDTFGFTEGLYVSALTAYRFFEWLTTDGGFLWPGAKPAKLWLHLAPTAAELAEAPEMNDGYSAADYTTIRLGLSEWYRAMKRIVDTDDDCAVLFFSGHGVSYGGGGQLLLPADWPDPREAAGPNRAFQTAHIHEAVSALKVNHATYFIDACWENGSSKIGQFRHISSTPLPIPDTAGMHNVNQLKPILYAANSGSITWQPKHPSGGLSFFGRALLDSLEPGGAPVDGGGCTDHHCPVRFASLVPEVRRRMVDIVRSVNPDLLPKITDGGNGISEAKATWHPAGDRPGPAPDGPEPTPTEEERLTEHHESTWRPGDGFDELHRLTGHESISWPSMGMRFYDLAGSMPVDGDYVIHRVRHDQRFNEVRYDLAIPDGAPVGRTWMMLTDPNYWEPAWACRLPLGGSALYQLHHLPSTDGGRPTIDVRFSTENDGVIGEIAHRWIVSLDATAADGFGDDVLELVQVVAGKFRDQAALVAAEVAAAMLYRTNFKAIPTSWLENLRGLGSVDGAVLLARRLVNEQPAIDATEIDRVLGNVRVFGLPTLQVTTEILYQLADRFRAKGTPLSIATWLNNTRGRLQGSGLFATYVGWVGNVGPWMAYQSAWLPDRILELLRDYDFVVPDLGATGPAADLPVPASLLGEGPVVVTAYQNLSATADSYGSVEAVDNDDLARMMGMDVADLDNATAELRTQGLITTIVSDQGIRHQLASPVPTVWPGEGETELLMESH